MKFTQTFIPALCLLASAASAESVSIGSAPQGGLAYASSAAIAQALTEQTGHHVSVVPQGGPPLTLPMVASGELDFSIATAIAAGFGYKGMTGFPEPLENLRVVATMYPLDFSFFVRADSDIQSLANVAGHRVPWGFPQQRNNGAVVEAYLAAAGLGEGDIQPVLTPTGSKSMDDFATGRVDAAAFSMGSGREKEVAASVGGIRYLGLPEDHPDIDALIAEHAPGALSRRIAAGEYEFVTEDIDAISSPFVIMTSAETPDELVYDFIKAIHTNKETLAEAVPSFAKMDETRLALDVGIPIHSGAEAYLRDAGLLSE